MRPLISWAVSPCISGIAPSRRFGSGSCQAEVIQTSARTFFSRPFTVTRSCLLSEAALTAYFLPLSLQVDWKLCSRPSFHTSRQL